MPLALTAAASSLRRKRHTRRAPSPSGCPQATYLLARVAKGIGALETGTWLLDRHRRNFRGIAGSSTDLPPGFKQSSAATENNRKIALNQSLLIVDFVLVKKLSADLRRNRTTSTKYVIISLCLLIDLSTWSSISLIFAKPYEVPSEGTPAEGSPHSYASDTRGSRCWIRSTSSTTSAARRNPHEIKSARIARLPLSVEGRGIQELARLLLQRPRDTGGRMCSRRELHPAQEVLEARVSAEPVRPCLDSESVKTG
jgi:hypothetical protein